MKKSSFYCSILSILEVLPVQGWEFAHWFFERMAGFLWAKVWFAQKNSEPLTVNFFKEWWEQFPHGCSFVQSNESKSLPELFKKEQLSKKQWEHFTLGHKKEEKQWKTVKNI